MSKSGRDGGQARGQAGRVPPYDEKAEQAILGAILLNNASLESAEVYVRPESFYLEKHRRIFRAMLEVRNAGQPIDAVTLGNRLITNGDLEKIGGTIALEGLTEAVATVANVDHYAAIVSDLEAARRMIYAAQQVVAEGFGIGGGGGVVDFVAKAHSLVTGVEVRTAERPRTLFSYADDVRKAYDAARAGVAGLPTPWPTVNGMTGGLRWGTITAFVARPSVGKSTICMLIAKHVWELPDREERILVVSPEMSAQDMAERYFVADAKVPYMSVVRGQLSDFETPKLWSSMERLRGQDRLWILDAAGNELSERSLDAAIKSVRPTLVAIDSFYDLVFPGRDDNERVRNIARWLYQSCKRNRYACVVGSQQNREQEKAKNKGGGSRLGTIAFSDAIAQRFDAIFAMERDEKLKTARRLRLRPLKIRRGLGMETVELHWDFTTMDFSEADGQGEQFTGDAEAAKEIPY